jgi:hypothetical protein
MAAMSPTRAELEHALATQYGFTEYAAFREFFAAEFGKGMLRQLESEMKRKEKESGQAAPTS